MSLHVRNNGIMLLCLQFSY